MNSTLTRLVAVTVFAFTSQVAFAQTDTPEKPPLPDALHDLITEYKDLRIDLLDDRQQLLRAFRDAETDGQRRLLIQAFKEQHREQLDRARDLRKAYRLRVMEIRRQRRTMLRDGTAAQGSGSSSG